MNKKTMTILAVAVAVIAAGLLIYPHITIQTEDKLIACRYSDDISGFETEVSPDENYTYWAERDVTWSGFHFRKFGPFYVLVFDIEEGNTIASKYVLDQEYLDAFLAEAAIDVVEKDYKEIRLTTDDVVAMIAGKTPLKNGGRYTCPDYDAATTIYYTLHGKENVMYIYETDGLLVIQVGYPDEGPKYIAYE
ncbi:MAG: hypothetical protein IKJ77_09675 [Firmicutes bacterium]|nr:hypothetical protein [Bacillota bacterium]